MSNSSLNGKSRKRPPSYICFVGETNPKQRIDVRGLVLVEPDDDSLVVHHDEETNALYAVRGGKRYPVEFDYGR